MATALDLSLYGKIEVKTPKHDLIIRLKTGENEHVSPNIFYFLNSVEQGYNSGKSGVNVNTKGRKWHYDTVLRYQPLPFRGFEKAYKKLIDHYAG